MRFAFLSVCWLAAIFAFPLCGNAQWGDVAMKFVYDGKPPKPMLVLPGHDGVAPRDETWLVDKDGGVKNVVVRLLPEKDAALPIHPDFEKAKGTNVRVDLISGYFEPRITIKYTNQDLTFTNLDSFAYAVRADFVKNSPFNVLVAGKKLVTLPADKNGLNKHESAVVPLAESIHPGMKGYLLIHSHPYAAVSDEEGKVTLKNVPVGEWTFVLWHESGGYIRQGKLDGVASEWPKGRIKIKVEPKVNKVGVITFK